MSKIVNWIYKLELTSSWGYFEVLYRERLFLGFKDLLQAHEPYGHYLSSGGFFMAVMYVGAQEGRSWDSEQIDTRGGLEQLSVSSAKTWLFIFDIWGFFEHWKLPEC